MTPPHGDSKSAQTEKRLEHLHARGPVVPLADSNFTRYVDGRTRPYHAVVLFTAMKSSYNCAACRYIYRERDVPLAARIQDTSGWGTYVVTTVSSRGADLLRYVRIVHVE